MIEVYKILHDLYDKEVTTGILNLSSNTSTRGHSLKWQLHAPGTASRQLLGTRRHYLPSGAAWRHGCLNWHWRDTDLILRLHFVSFFI